MTVQFQKDDGGRAAAGYKKWGDCVIRAIAIAGQEEYQTVADAMGAGMMANGMDWKGTKRTEPRQKHHKSGRDVQNAVMKQFGFAKHTLPPEMGRLPGSVFPTIEQAWDFFGGPGKSIIVYTSKHAVAIVDGVIRDTWDCRYYIDRDGFVVSRKAFQVWMKEE